MIQIPSKDDYSAFMERFTRGLSKLDSTPCFYTFGSFNNNGEPCNYGRSDIDGGIILNSGVVTPKPTILLLAENLAHSAKGVMRTQFNLLDRETNRDGRFLSYTTDYTDYLKSSSVIHSGPNFVSEMSGLNFKSGVLYSAAFNLSGPRGVRNTLLYSLDYFGRDKDGFVEKATKALEKVAKFPRKLVYLREGQVMSSRADARQKLETITEGVDLSVVDNINYLIRNPIRLYKQLSDFNEALKLLIEGLDCMERMVGAYVKKFPSVSDNEIKV